MTQNPFITIVAGPIHLIGEARQVEAFYKTGKGSLPPWWEEWDQLLGETWGMDVLESPSDVTRLMNAAHANPSKPRVGFISNSKLKLESGVALGGENRDVSHVAKRLYAYWQTVPPAMQDKYPHFASIGSIEGLLFRRDHYAQMYWSSDEQGKTLYQRRCRMGSCTLLMMARKRSAGSSSQWRGLLHVTRDS